MQLYTEAQKDKRQPAREKALHFEKKERLL